MKKLPVLAVLAAFAASGVVGLAQADPPKPPKPPKPHNCNVRNEGFEASGKLVTSTLTPSGKGRYSGSIEVNVAKANHHAATGDQTYTLTNARVKFHPHGATAVAGSRVKLSGKITELPKGCPTGTFTSTITITKVDINKPAKPKK